MLLPSPSQMPGRRNIGMVCKECGVCGRLLVWFWWRWLKGDALHPEDRSHEREFRVLCGAQDGTGSSCTPKQQCVSCGCPPNNAIGRSSSTSQGISLKCPIPSHCRTNLSTKQKTPWILLAIRHGDDAGEQGEAGSAAGLDLPYEWIEY